MPPQTVPAEKSAAPREARPAPEPTQSTSVKPGEPVLPDSLRRNCQITGGGNFDNVGLATGETAVNFTLKDIHGIDYRLSRLLVEKPVVMAFGSFT